MGVIMNHNKNQPLVSLVLLSYNQERFIREAVKSAINQDYSNLEILISDDCSTDGTFNEINAVVVEYESAHHIKINKNPRNMGLVKHFNQAISSATGEIIVLAAGDDISLPQRVSKTVTMLLSSPDATFASFTDIVIDENGVALSKAKKIKKSRIQKISLSDYIGGTAQKLSGASRGFRRCIYDVFGDLNEKCQTEDTTTILRGLMIGSAFVSSDPGILYRQHSCNLSRPSSIHSMEIREIINQYISDANYAYSVGIIAESTLNMVREWAERIYRRRLFVKRLYEIPINLFSTFFIVACNKDFRVREKAGMLIRSIMKKNL